MARSASWFADLEFALFGIILCQKDQTFHYHAIDFEAFSCRSCIAFAESAELNRAWIKARFWLAFSILLDYSRNGHSALT